MAKKKEKITVEDIERYRIIADFGKFLVGAVAFVICVWRVVDLLEKMAARPWYATVLIALVAPSGLLFFVLKFAWRVYRRMMVRNKDLEEVMDPARTSSGLKIDGTNPPEDKQ